ncbi:DinB family protein [Parapedobacter tibetensis]|uniref:DinB family protein n=1 Tax=Parapedobacter tibetensis TaxID=2972951 RepID=UPI00214DD2C6|nr:DinB family protein [Parapedobacter tibetensis]
MQSPVFNYIKRTRELFVRLLEELSLEEINEVPNGFRNNIGWNFGHIVVSTQALCYLRTGIVLQDIEIPFFGTYQKGSKPEKWIAAEELETLKTQAFTSIERIERDIQDGVFAEISPYATSTYGVEMNNIHEIITCTLMHDNLHLGYATALKKAVKEQKRQLHK